MVAATPAEQRGVVSSSTSSTLSAAAFTDLPAGLVQDILRHLDLKEQGRAACVSKLCAAAVLPLAPALAHYVTAGDAQAVRRLLQKPGAWLGLDNPSCMDGRRRWLRTIPISLQPCSRRRDRAS